MLLSRFYVFLATLMVVTTIYHLLKNSPTVVKPSLVKSSPFSEVGPLPLLRPIAPMKPLHVVVGPPTRYEHDMTALYAFAPISSDLYRPNNAYRRRSSSSSRF